MHRPDKIHPAGTHSVVKSNHRSILASVTITSRLVLLAFSLIPAASPVASASEIPNSNPPYAPVAITTQPNASIEALARSGILPDLRWPDFRDVARSVIEFYSAAGWRPAWTRNGQPTVQAATMIDLLRRSDFKGLVPEDYDASRWNSRMARLKPSVAAPATDDIARFDLALTICAMRYFSALHNGRVNPQRVRFELTQGPKPLDLASFLRTKVIGGNDLPGVAASVEPHYAGYQRIERVLPRFIELAGAGDIKPLPIPQAAIHPGDRFDALALLEQRLRQLGDLPVNAPPPHDLTYEGALVTAVKGFQRRHGLDVDGVLGKNTVRALNVPLRQRLVQLDLTLERYRWIPPEFPQPPIQVNIPEFRLRTMRRQPAPFISMAVVVGRAYRSQTPVFADYMKYVIFRPYWNVPLSIQLHELVPKISRDRNYLVEHNYEVVTNSGAIVTDGVVQASFSFVRGLVPKTPWGW
jgi:murein L,D-transpeptidase YcbB/YkuD